MVVTVLLRIEFTLYVEEYLFSPVYSAALCKLFLLMKRTNRVRATLLPGHWQHFISGDIEFMLLATMLPFYSGRSPDIFVFCVIRHRAIFLVCGPIFFHFLRAFFSISPLLFLFSRYQVAI